MLQLAQVPPMHPHPRVDARQGKPPAKMESASGGNMSAMETLTALTDLMNLTAVSYRTRQTTGRLIQM